MGYPSELSWLLSCLSTNIAPVSAHDVGRGASAATIRAVRHAEMLARTRHLPQGRPRHRRSIVRDEGFRVNHSKSRLARKGARQKVTGVVVNDRPTVARADVERLEAILYNCARYGPATQNREKHADFRAHLRRRIAHVAGIDAKRAERLYELFEAIVWE